ncbi:SecY interacting protein Syd [Aquisphaera giovannonii]|uniref:SecY interacting protein Syd n=1 Tax=Aquisphaera giovannonii TaxID=406548 RepID=A0A5B9W2S5_9BACT|nr:SecY-interacting protein Syd [Aquisphaera giovannonii]QEH34888.1 SecY interacting protein Syd [Aquisphaera giovannonii]
MGEVKAALARILAREATLLAGHDPEWTSPCEVGEPDGDARIRWRPVEITPPPDFLDVEAEAGVILHPDVKEFYGSYFGRCDEQHFRGMTALLKVSWNPEELAILKRQIVEHLRICPTIPAPFTVFFASTDGDPFFSVDNASGEVLLEEPGRPDAKVVAPSLAAFLAEV